MLYSLTRHVMHVLHFSCNPCRRMYSLLSSHIHSLLSFTSIITPTLTCTPSLCAQSGTKNRCTKSTDYNDTSSRSHAILQLSFELEKQIESGQTMLIRSKLSFADLAGNEKMSTSESLSDSRHLKEMTSINQSLSTLGNVISALSSKKPHVPYRESKLTRILQVCACRRSTSRHSSVIFQSLRPLQSSVLLPPMPLSLIVSYFLIYGNCPPSACYTYCLLLSFSLLSSLPSLGFTRWQHSHHRDRVCGAHTASHPRDGDTLTCLLTLSFKQNISF